LSVAFLCLIDLELHLPENASLKGKRKEVKSLRAQLIRRFGAAVAETDHHDLWQRGTLTIALVGAQHAEVSERADALQRFAESRLEDQVRWERKILTTGDVWED
jgi:uncharacterized protein YlxP (DUF503 family)